jgi:hypothetical protein
MDHYPVDYAVNGQLRRLQRAAVTQQVMSACTTSVPALSTTLAGTTISAPSLIEVKFGGSSRACARNEVVAFSRFIWTIWTSLSAFRDQ